MRTLTYLTIILLVGLLLSLLYPWLYQTFFHSLPEAEVQTYGLGILLSTVFISLWHWLHPIVPKTLVIIVFVVFVTLLFLLDSIPMVPVLADMELLQPMSIVSYLTTFLFLTLVFTHKAVIPHFVAIVFIALLTFHVGYMSIYDFTHYAGPTNDILHGIPPLSTVSPYGFLSVLTLSGIFSFIPLSLFHLHIVNAIIVTVGYLGFYLLATYVIKNKSLALFASIFAIFGTWLTGIGYRGSFPQSSMLRFGLWILVAHLIQKRSRFVIPALVFTLFWTFDSGVYVLGAYILTQWFLSLNTLNFINFINFLKNIKPTLISVILGMLVISVLYLAIWKTIPAWQNYLWKTASFLSGPFLVPLPQSIIPWIVLAPCVIMICHLVANQRKNAVLFFISFYGILQFLYFISRSHFNNLHHIALPSILMVFVFIDWFLLHNKKFISKIILACLLALPMQFVFSQGIQNLKKENIATTIQTIRSPKGTEQEIFDQTANVIEHRYGKDVGFLSLYDTWYLVLLKTTNSIGSSCLACYSSPQTIEPVVSQILTNPPLYLFVDANQFDREGQVSWVYPRISYLYEKIDSIGALDGYKRK